MINEKIQKKILKEMKKKYVGIENCDVEWAVEKAITLTIAEEKKRHDEFVEKLSDNILLDFDLSKEEDLVIIGYNKCLRDVLNKIVKTNKEIYGE